MKENDLVKITQKIIRGIRIWTTVIQLVAFLWWDSKGWTYLEKKNKSKRQNKRAVWLTSELINLGSAFIKIGQLLSARPDILPSGWVVELSNLQDKVPPFSFIKAQNILKSELGILFKEIYNIDHNPLGSASLAQVHRAELKNGRQIVLKIQRPGLEELFRLDLDIMQQVAFVLQKHPRWSRGRDWVGIAKECKKVLLKELDFQIEAEYAARFKQQFLGDQTIKIPNVIWEYSTKKILCLDYLPGIKINDIKRLNENGIEPKTIAKIGTTSYLQQLVKFGFFHADPHPGNLAVSPDGALIYYDFGMMGLISEGLRKRIGTMVKFVASKDAVGLVRELQEAGLITADIDIGPVRRLLRVMFKEALTPPFTSNMIERISGDLYDLVYGKPFRIPVELIFVMRALSTFEGVGRNLDPEFNLMSIAKPYIIPIMSSNDPNTNDLINELGRQVSFIGSKAVKLPKRIDESLEKLEQGDLQLQVKIGESDRRLRRIAIAQQGVSQAIFIGSLSITAAILASSKQSGLAFIPLIFALPASFGWLKLQLKLGKDNRIDQIPNRK